MTSKELATLKASGLASHILTEPGVAGELQRLSVLHPRCPKRANALTKTVYANLSTIISALRLIET